MVFAIITLVIIKKPGAAVGALLCTYGLEQWAQSQSAFFFQHQSLTNLVTACVCAFAIVMRFLQRKPVIQPVTPEFWIAFVIYAMAAASITWTVFPEGTWGYYLSNLKYIIIFTLMMPLAIADFDDLKASLFTLLGVGFLISFWLLIFADWSDRNIVFKSGNIFSAQGMDRGNPLAVASMGGEAAIAAVLMNFQGRAKFWRVFRYVIFAVGFALAVKSGSRGQAVGLIIATLVFLPYSRRFKDLAGFIGFAVSVALFMALSMALFDYVVYEASMSSTAAERWSIDDFFGAYEGGRVQTSMQLLRAWADAGPIYWLVGLGSSASYDPNIIGMYPHVVFAEVLGELGLIGWAILWLVPIYATLALSGLWKFTKDDPENRGLVAALGAILFFEIILSFKQGSLLGSHAIFGIFIILGRIYALQRQRAAELEQINAGGYAMTEDDWDQTDDDAALPGRVAVNR